MYVDGFVLQVPKKNLAEYEKMAADAGKVWMKHGALEYYECVGDDLDPDMEGIRITTFPQMTKARPEEMVMFSFIVYKSRAHRDEVNAKVMKDPLMNQYEGKTMPFDVKRMAYGGFKALVALKSEK